jgi:arsenate reductase
MSSITLYGIKNCDSVKKARKWLDENCVKYTFHDFRVDDIKKSMISEFLENIEIELLINKRGTSWRKLSNKEKNIRTKIEAVELLFENPTIIKRPIIKTKGKYLVGFDKEKFELLK